MRYPMTFSKYKAKHAANGYTQAAKQRYEKAKAVYRLIQQGRGIWKDRDFGVLTKPKDAFEIWWDL